MKVYRFNWVVVVAYLVVATLLGFVAFVFFADQEAEERHNERISVSRELSEVGTYLMLCDGKYKIMDADKLIAATEEFERKNRWSSNLLPRLRKNPSVLEVGEGVRGKLVGEIKPGTIVLRYRSSTYSRDLEMPIRMIDGS